ncbi:MAG: FtsQ-type POTRA domain-containing protein [bacterium]
MKKSYRKPHQFRRKKTILKNKIFRLGILIFIIFGAVSYFLFFSDFFQIKKVFISGEKKVAKKDIESFFPKKNIFLIDAKAIKGEILNTFPQVAGIEIKREFPDSLNVIIAERAESAVFCQARLSFSSENLSGQEEKCFLLDKEGIVFEEISLEDNPRQAIRNLLIGRELALGERAVNGEYLSGILQIRDELTSSLGISLWELIISSGDKLTVLVLGGWEIYFDLQKDIDWQLTKLRAVLEEKIPEDKRGELEYIELRFGNLAPFKYR